MWGGGGLYSTTTNVQHPLGWCDGCHRTAAPVRYRWRGESHRANQVDALATHQIKSNQITFIVTSPQHKCLGEWNSYERAPDSAKKTNKQFTYGQTVQKNNKQFTYGQTVQKNCTGAFTVLQTVQKKKKTIYIWTVHIYRLYRRQCAKYTYIYSVHIVYYKDTLNYQRHIIHRMGTSALCTVSIHNLYIM